MKRGAGGFTELVAVIPGEVIASLEAVMAGNFMHGVAPMVCCTSGELRGITPRSSVALKQQVLIGLGG